ncbi:hypothetical protein BDV95DRAFT_582723 [Massariosphaeria phaeospora]|uniref:Uncharacterized protein n=1 Tax=Massariosphaeria phaeospora TaxID=100035 RepID=A0A7C8M4A9_9PLEO|nr:hypothetical protein BDV95DRAFT_582723 [Massariosphaeria phaeospora]
MSIHMPIRTLRPLYRQYVLHRPAAQPFSSTVPAQARMQARKRQTDPAGAEGIADNLKEQAPSVSIAENGANERFIPDDLGILQGSFIRASWRKLPSVFSRARWQYEWKYLKSYFTMYLSLFRYRKLRDSRPRPIVDYYPWSYGHLKNSARTKYEHVYKAFANGDEAKLQKLCNGGLAKQFKQRIAQRPNGSTMDWTVRFKHSRTIDNRCAEMPFPGWDETGVRQVTVLLDTEQTLTVRGTTTLKAKKRVAGPAPSWMWTPAGFAPEAPKDEDDALYQPIDSVTTKRVREYIVLQKRMMRGVEDKDWKVLGFAEETTPESIAADEEHEKRLLDQQFKPTA